MFRAYDPEHERLVAIKLFRLDLVPERVHQLVASFERIIAAELNHPVIAAPVSTGISDVAAYLVHDYIAADSLDLVVREYGPAPPADALRVAAQLAAALDFAAAVNIVHGALHPRDVLLSTDETRLTGIGVARALDQVGVTAPIRRPYTAPERVAGASWDRRADVFSLAALMFELLWAKRVSGLGADAVDDVTPIDGGDLPALREAFRRALAENPEDRFPTALDFAVALKNAFPDVVVNEAPAPDASSRGSRMDIEPRLPLDGPDVAHSAGPELALRASPVSEREPELHPMTPRFEEVEVVPPPPVRAISVEEPPAAPPTGLITGSDPALSALDRSRSAVWPLALALTLGLAIGFAGGYGVGSRDRNTGAVATTGTAAGREFTESPVAETPKTVSEPATPAPVPAPSKPAATAAPAPAPPPAAGRLLIRSTPEGAMVSVDGREYGKTPATVRELSPGSHRVRVTRDGYAAQERRVVLSASRPAQSVNVALVPVRVAPAARTAQAPARPEASTQFAGALAVDSRPTGAKVYLDGRLIGSTPLSLPTVPAGEHAVRLEREGYRRWSSSVRIVASENNRVTASLER